MLSVLTHPIEPIMLFASLQEVCLCEGPRPSSVYCLWILQHEGGQFFWISHERYRLLYDLSGCG